VYVILRRGDRLPTVAYVQHRLTTSGLLTAPVAIDGHFGENTERSVREFQRAHGMTPTGSIDTNTWDALCYGDDRDVVESIDASDWVECTAGHGVLAEDREHLMRGVDPIVSIMYGQNMGMEEAIRRIVRRARPGRALLIRFHGHGSPGHMGVAHGMHGGVGPHGVATGDRSATQVGLSC